ncbi:hypothetical protein Dsin_014845 [Dipteronia sinensis]|uniref:BHLH domain-containing protein n=1 Tax=Dipteronia sinensis TaxID=43782 RepID=A0AAE0ANM2_9ROSI|nr:hypothetical protein Dsin_032514 [Dipteronia sinensis]KAK3220875.1 hypothetical protein Dsin_014845 [Dipteronia sinensis]
MFPLHTGDELFFSVSSSNPRQDHQYKIPQDLILDDHHASLDDSDITHNNSMGKSRRRKLSCAMTDTNEFTSSSGNSNNKNKKMMHRDIERQRRQEMATLHASLRSLLPLEFIKGKRSISDQMNEAVNYINYLQKRIKQLSDERDERKKLSKTSTLVLSGTESSSVHNISPTQVIVRPCLVGVEVVYSCGYRDQALPLSRVLAILHDQGLCVVNCISTRVNEQLLHTIQTEVNDPSCFNLSVLQRKLAQGK